MFHEFAEAFLLVFLAEMGDKSQLLAMAFAARYPVRKVLSGILIGAFLNDGLAVLFGSLVSSFLPIKAIQIAAGFVFVIFGVRTLKPDLSEENYTGNNLKFGPILTVASIYFIGEFGDKTQLTAIVLASQAVYPVMIFAGTILGMSVTGAIGIFIGKRLGDKLPETAIRITTSALFLFFGIVRLAENLPPRLLTPINTLLFFVVIIIAVVYYVRSLIAVSRKNQETDMIRRSKDLHSYYKRIRQDFENICLGAEKCGMCQGNKCIVGYTKTLIRYGLNDGLLKYYDKNIKDIRKTDKPFNRKQAFDSLLVTLQILKKYSSGEDLAPVNEIRRNLEMILFGKSIQEITDWQQYENKLYGLNDNIAAGLFNNLNKN